MKTYMAHANDVVRKWYVVDAEGVVLGRLSAEIAKILRGKHKPSYVPNLDCGDYVVVINAEKAVLTGSKLDKKFYHHHTGWIGGMKSVNYRTLMATKADKAMYLAVEGMLPGNKIGSKAMTRLRVYKGAQHEQAAQKPEAIEL